MRRSAALQPNWRLTPPTSLKDVRYAPLAPQMKWNILISTAFIFLSGHCLTIMTVYNNYGARDVAVQKTIVYSGVRASNPVIPGGFYSGNSPPVLCAYFGFALIDPLFSFVLDTALLPITVPWAIYEESRPQKYKCDCFDDYSDFEECKKRGKCANPSQTPTPNGRSCHPEQSSQYTGPFCVLRYQ